tara:strand:+ start:40 stop:669 length:630 start_codon:yes stop_codon:yes gene_type:complete
MDRKKKWTEQDNQTLIELHIKSKYYKELYERVGKFYRTLDKLLGFTCVISSSVATSIFWIDNDSQQIESNTIECSDNEILLKSLLGIMTLSTILQNIVSFVETSNEYLETSFSYGKIQFKIESIGDIHPARRNGGPKKTLPTLRDATNKLSQNSDNINGCLQTLCHNKKKVESYMDEKHNNYKKEDISDEEDSGDYDNYGIDDNGDDLF